MTKEEFKEAIEQAHMAGQRNAGVDPSYHAALEWFQSEIQKSVNENKDLACVNTRFGVFSKIDDVFTQLSVCTYESKEEAESFADAMIDTIKYYDTEIVILNVR